MLQEWHMKTNADQTKPSLKRVLLYLAMTVVISIALQVIRFYLGLFEASGANAIVSSLVYSVSPIVALILVPLRPNK